MIRKMVSVGLAVAAGALVVASAASATTWDAFSSFNGTNGAGGFTYGSYDGATQAFTPFTGDAGGCGGLIDGVICLDGGSSSLPAAFKTTEGAHQSGTVLVPADALILHPGPDAGEDSAVFFTAPTSGVYKITVSTFVADVNPSGVLIYGLEDGFSDVFLTSLGANNASFSGVYTGFLNANQKIGLGVDYDGVYYNDSTGVNFTISTVPEPAAWALMLVGFGGLGAAMRTRRRMAVAA